MNCFMSISKKERLSVNYKDEQYGKFILEVIYDPQPQMFLKKFQEQGVANSELIIRKTTQQELTTVKNSPPATQKMTKKLSSISFKPKIPHSPNIKRRKTGVEKGKEVIELKTCNYRKLQDTLRNRF